LGKEEKKERRKKGNLKHFLFFFFFFLNPFGVVHVEDPLKCGGAIPLWAE